MRYLFAMIVFENDYEMHLWFPFLIATLWVPLCPRTVLDVDECTITPVPFLFMEFFSAHLLFQPDVSLGIYGPMADRFGY